MIKIYPKLREQTYWHIELPFSIHVFLRRGGGADEDEKAYGGRQESKERAKETREDVSSGVQGAGQMRVRDVRFWR